MSRKQQRDDADSELLALYRVLERFGALEPWKWLGGAPAFGVRDPESGRVGCVIITGAGEGPPSIRLESPEYMLSLGPWLRTYDNDPVVEEALCEKALVAEFGPKADLKPWDLPDLRRLGVRENRSDRWPTLYSQEPYSWPCRLSPPQVRTLKTAIEQALEVLERCRLERGPLKGEAEGVYLVRELRGGAWGYTRERLPLAPPLTAIPYVPEAVELLRRYPAEGEWDLQMMVVPEPAARDGRGRAYMAIGIYLWEGGPEEAPRVHASTWPGLPSGMTRFLAKSIVYSRRRLAIIRVQSEFDAQFVEPLLIQLGIIPDTSPIQAEVKRSMEALKELLVGETDLPPELASLKELLLAHGPAVPLADEGAKR